MKMIRDGRSPRVFISAGEASGDLHGSFLVRALRELEPNARVSALGGPLLARAGADILVDNRELALIGILEVFRKLRRIYAGLRGIREHWRTSRPDLVILIDFPDFNFLLGRLARRLGIPVLYYIAPQVWAWRRGRTRSLKRFATRLAVILPFEPAFFARYGVPVEHVGHPLVDVLATAPSRDQARRRYVPDGDAGFLIGLLPGSRGNEIKRLLPLLLGAAQRLAAEHPRLRFLLPLANQVNRGPVDQAVAAGRAPVQVVSGDTYGAIRACDLVLSASGTVTLETAILGTPLIIIYRVSALEAAIARRLIKVHHIGLPNLIAGRAICPEILQQQASAAGIAGAAELLLNNPERLGRQRRDLARLIERLGPPGVAHRVAQLAQDLLTHARTH